MLLSFALRCTKYTVWWIIVQVNKARSELTTDLDFKGVYLNQGSTRLPAIQKPRPNSRGSNRWHEASFRRRTHKYGVTSNSHCYLALSTRCIWNYSYVKNAVINLRSLSVTTQNSMARMNMHLEFVQPSSDPYLFTIYLLKPWGRVLLEKLSGLRLVNKFPAFYVTRRFITALISARHLSLSWASSIQSISPHPTSRISSDSNVPKSNSSYICCKQIGFKFDGKPLHLKERRNTPGKDHMKSSWLSWGLDHTLWLTL